MNRTRGQWQSCNPYTMQTPFRVLALKEAMEDILELHAEVERLRSLCSMLDEKKRQQEEYYKEVTK